MIVDVEEVHLYLLGVPNEMDGDAFEASLEGDPRIVVAAAPWPRPSQRCPFPMIRRSKAALMRGVEGTVGNELQ